MLQNSAGFGCSYIRNVSSTMLPCSTVRLVRGRSSLHPLKVLEWDQMSDRTNQPQLTRVFATDLRTNTPPPLLTIPSIHHRESTLVSSIQPYLRHCQLVLGFASLRPRLKITASSADSTSIITDDLPNNQRWTIAIEVKTAWTTVKDAGTRKTA